MNKNARVIILIFCAFFLQVGEVQAKALSEFSGLTQYTSGFASAQLISDQIYDRYKYDMVGGRFDILNYRTYSGDVAVPDDGDTWKLELYQSGGLGPIGITMLIYDASLNCLLVNGISPLFCNFAVPPGEYGWKYYTVDISWTRKCAKTTDHSVFAYEPTQSSNWPFRPTRFRPGFYAVLTPESMRPFLPGDNYSNNRRLLPVQGDTSPIQAFVTDDLGCLRPVVDAEVSFEMRVTPNTGGHAHFSSLFESGTGRFVLRDGSPEPRTTNSTQTKISAQTDPYGHVLAYYKAGEHGTTETLVATARIDAVSEKDPAWEVTAEKTVNVKVPGLIEVANNSADHAFIYGGGCPHNPEARWMSPEMAAKTGALSSWYSTTFGAQLSLNDASLQFGGFFDNNTEKGGGRDARCHGSHRQGIDIDINSIDRGGANIRYAVVGKRTRLELLTHRAEMLWMEKIPEGYSIHFRNLSHQ